MIEIGGNIDAVLQKRTVTQNAIGEPVDTWTDVQTLYGWLDLQSGDKTNVLSAWLEDSTHVFVCDYVPLPEGLTRENARLICDGKRFEVLDIDNPMRLGYQLEISLKLLGWQ